MYSNHKDQDKNKKIQQKNVYAIIFGSAIVGAIVLVILTNVGSNLYSKYIKKKI